MKHRLLVLTAVAIIGAAGLAQAHHSMAKYDAKKTVTLAGTVKEFLWTNPHIWIVMAVEDTGTRQPVEWRVEGAGPTGLFKRGWKRTSLNPGDKAVVTIHPMVDGSASGSLVKATVNGVVLGGGDGN